METTTIKAEPVLYKGWTIVPTTDPWAIRFGAVYDYFIDGEKVYYTTTEQQAKDEIDELIRVFS